MPKIWLFNVTKPKNEVFSVIEVPSIQTLLIRCLRIDQKLFCSAENDAFFHR